ncbi:MAG: hypothetical protein M3Y33_15585 [Actinomycetota bacterium]|nr:hypothetical protein [Actinomycetota bacterium]
MLTTITALALPSRFLSWLGHQGIALSECTQAHANEWLAGDDIGRYEQPDTARCLRTSFPPSPRPLPCGRPSAPASACWT